MNMLQTLDRLLDPVGRSLGVKTAMALANLRAEPDVQQRMEYLATRCTEGELTVAEQAEYQAFIMANNLIGILQAKARAVLARRRKKK
jgi:hypothetical protein